MPSVSNSVLIDFLHLSVKSEIANRVARWYIFIQKSVFEYIFGRNWNGKFWDILLPFGIFYGHLVLFTAIWYILLSFGYIFPVLVCCTKKNLAPLIADPSVTAIRSHHFSML
jgi:hypothetical protein